MCDSSQKFQLSVKIKIGRFWMSTYVSVCFFCLYLYQQFFGHASKILIIISIWLMIIISEYSVTNRM